jgi:uncharacterized membrane protein YgcG
MNNMKPIAAAIVICAGAYLIVAAWQVSATSGATPVGTPLGYGMLAIGLWLLFVTWVETGWSERPLWLRFKIRDLLWLTLVAALLAAWFVDHRDMETKLGTSGYTGAGVGGGGFGGGGGGLGGFGGGGF